MSNWTTLDWDDRISNWWDSLTDEEQKEVIEFEYLRRFKVIIE